MERPGMNEALPSTPHFPPPSSSSTPDFSTDAVARLEQSIKHMVTTLLEEGLIQKDQVINLLEDIIQTIEATTTKR